jgi:hypothetical protein
MMTAPEKSCEEDESFLSNSFKKYSMSAPAKHATAAQPMGNDH